MTHHQFSDLIPLVLQEFCWVNSSSVLLCVYMAMSKSSTVQYGLIDRARATRNRKVCKPSMRGCACGQPASVAEAEFPRTLRHGLCHRFPKCLRKAACRKSLA